MLKSMLQCKSTDIKGVFIMLNASISALTVTVFRNLSLSPEVKYLFMFVIVLGILVTLPKALMSMLGYFDGRH